MKLSHKQQSAGPVSRRRRRAGRVVVGVLLALAALIGFGTGWYRQRFTTGFQELLFTLSSPVTGASASETRMTIEHTLMPVLCVEAVYVLVLLLLDRTRAGRAFTEAPPRWFRALPALICAAALCGAFAYADAELEILGYYRHKMNPTRIYEERYVDPGAAALAAPAEKKNLIVLYLESMENSYLSVEEGGLQPENYIPRLTALAGENFSFSDSERQGGWVSVLGTNWTSGALLATTSGLPFELPVNPSAMASFPRFMPGITALGDILARDGYTQEFLCGSDGNYAGRSTYFMEHGDYEIFDLFTAREKGYVPEDYFVWWGFEDRHLFRIARDEITRLAESGQPFNFSFPTVDAHHPSGYVCELCGDEYEHPLANVLRCTDNQVADFVAWCEEQPFWEDTVLIIVGDHTRMDSNLVGDTDRLERTVYNCFLHAQKEPVRTRNRAWTAMDMLPTTLSALGYEIPGDRLGLGTDMFSASPTLAEEMGMEAFELEINKYSAYYLEQFSKEK